MTNAPRRRIVVVDDDAAVLRAVQRQLDTLGWEAHGAATGSEALALLRRLGRVDAVLTDVEMPVMDGVALGHEVVNRFPGTAVILMSGGAHPATIDRTTDQPPPTLLRKPFTLQALAAALDGTEHPIKRGEA